MNIISQKNQPFTVDLEIVSPKCDNFTWVGADIVVIYNFSLLTIDTNINQFIKVYHNFHRLQQIYRKIYEKNT